PGGDALDLCARKFAPDSRSSHPRPADPTGPLLYTEREALLQCPDVTAAYSSILRFISGLRAFVRTCNEPAGLERPRPRPHSESGADDRGSGGSGRNRTQAHSRGHSVPDPGSNLLGLEGPGMPPSPYDRSYWGSERNT